MAEKLFVQGDINVTMLDPANNYIPVKSDDPEEVEMFQLAGPGVVKLVRQGEGAQVGVRMLEAAATIEDPSVRAYVAKSIGVASLTSAWHLFAEAAPDTFDDPIDRRNVRYAYLATGNPGTPPSTEGIESATTLLAHDGVIETQLLLGAFVLDPRRFNRQSKVAARTLGRGAMWMAVQARPGGLEAYGSDVTDYDAQYFAKRCGQWLKKETAQFAIKTGVNPSLAQFAPNDRDSELARHFRLQAPNKAVRDIYDAAIATKVVGIKQFFPIYN